MIELLPFKIKELVQEWKNNNYQSEYSILAEILEYNSNSYLRRAQFEALETYWYLRIKENTTHIFDLYKKYSQIYPNYLKH